MGLSALTCESPQRCDFEPHVPFLFASGRHVLIAAGAKQLPPAACSSWSAQFAALASAMDADDDVPLVVGALPFDHERPAHLFQPLGVAHLAGDTERLGDVPLSAAGAPLPSRWQVTPEPPLEDYVASVAEIVKLLGSAGEGDDGALRKVVLARSLLLQADVAVDVANLARRLQIDASVTVFAVPLRALGSGRPRALVGATPELLVKKTGDIVTSHPLAGSAARCPYPDADERAAEALLRSDKERREHAVVVEWIADRLAPYCRELTVPPVPALVSTRSVWHLGTRLEGRLRDADVPSIALAEALHPTPAVCGVPLDRARAAIDRCERFDRGFFTGAIGWCDRRGDGRWMMTIRCADVTGASVRLYAGAGIVAGSDPAAEGAETSLKFRALLDALGVSEDGRIRGGSW